MSMWPNVIYSLAPTEQNELQGIFIHVAAEPVTKKAEPPCSWKERTGAIVT